MLENYWLWRERSSFVRRLEACRLFSLGKYLPVHIEVCFYAFNHFCFLNWQGLIFDVCVCVCVCVWGVLWCVTAKSWVWPELPNTLYMLIVKKIEGSNKGEQRRYKCKWHWHRKRMVEVVCVLYAAPCYEGMAVWWCISMHHNLCTKLSWGVIFMPYPLYPQQRASKTHRIGSWVGWTWSLFGCLGG